LPGVRPASVSFVIHQTPDLIAEQGGWANELPMNPLQSPFVIAEIRPDPRTLCKLGVVLEDPAVMEALKAIVF